MQPTDFTDDSWGKVIRAPGGYWAFVPRALPPEVDLTWHLAARLSEADRALSELAGTARNLPNPHLLISPFLRREAVLSSRIEGTQTSLSDLVLFEAAGDVAPSAGRVPADVREVANYVRALEVGLARLGEIPLSLRLVRELHGVLMHGAPGADRTPGEFRRSQNWIGPPGCTLEEAAFVPPPVPEMREALGAFERFLHAESPLPPLVRLALVHCQFEAIHPFLDGNGRVGRLLITLLLVHERLLLQPLLYLSAFFERHRQEYYRLLLGVSQRGCWEEWVEFFLAGVADQSRDGIWRAGRMLDLWRSYRTRIATARSSALLLRLVDSLFETPGLTARTAATLLGVTRRSATLNIQKLVEAGMLEEVTGRQRYRVFQAREIVELLTAPGPGS